jgi:hypothetical protein
MQGSTMFLDLGAVAVVDEELIVLLQVRKMNLQNYFIITISLHSRNAPPSFGLESSRFVTDQQESLQRTSCCFPEGSVKNSGMVGSQSVLVERAESSVPDFQF